MSGTIDLNDGIEFNTTPSLHHDLHPKGVNAAPNNQIIIDVNGYSKGPNCGQSEESNSKQQGSDCSSRTNGFDKFAIILYPNGQIKINPDDTWAIEAVKGTTRVTEK